MSFGVEVSPNPATNYIQVHLDAISTTVELSIMDMTGQIIRLIKTNSSITDIDVSDLSIGMYQLLIKSSNYQAIKRFVKY